MNWRNALEDNILTKRPLVVLTGPTAVGKTALSIRLAKEINGEIISADSMQVYKHMNIGTAKITFDDMQGIPHHLIDILEPTEDFNVSLFQKYAKKCINDIYSRGHIPILVGGTGFYIQAVLNEISFTEHPIDTKLRNELFLFADIHGAEALHKRLQELDNKAAANIHPNNIKRVVRAIEYCIQTNTKFSEHNEIESKRQSPYLYAYFVLTKNRDELYHAINQRVDAMTEMGLVSEVEQLLQQGCTIDMVSMKGLGYKEIIGALNGQYSIDRKSVV